MKKTAFLCAVLVLVAFCFAGCQTQQTLTVNEYLTKYEKEIDLEQKMDDKTFGNNDYRVFLTGETHTAVKSFQAKKMMIQYLHEQHGVNYIVEESGVASGFLEEYYIQTGDEFYLDLLMDSVQGTLACSEEEKDYLQWLHEYNSRQPENKKLHVFGLDVDHQLNLLPEAAALLAENNREEIKKEMQRLVSFMDKNPTEFQQNINQYLNKYQADFSKNLPFAQLLCDNLTNTAAFRAEMKNPNSEFHQIRDFAMMRNFCFWEEYFPDDTKFFGQFGSEHIYQKACTSEYSSAHYQRFGTLLQGEDSPVKGAVCSILYQYVQTSDSPRGGYIYQTPFDQFPQSIFERYHGTDLFIPLDHKNSPFLSAEAQGKTEEEISLLDLPEKQASGTTDYFQKLLILFDSEETTPYQPK